MTVRGFHRATETSTERSYELEEVLFRVRRGVHFPLRVRLPLVRNANAQRASGSADALATGRRPEELLRMACSWSIRHGVLFHLALYSLRSKRTRKRRSDAGASGGVSVRRPTFNLVRSPTINVQNPFRLDRWRGDPIHNRGRNRRRHLQTSDGTHHVRKGAVALTGLSELFSAI